MNVLAYFGGPDLDDINDDFSNQIHDFSTFSVIYNIRTLLHRSKRRKRERERGDSERERECEKG